MVTLNGWTLPWRVPGRQGVPPGGRAGGAGDGAGLEAHLWGYNGQSPGPTIEVVEGDQVRIFVTNRLPEHTSIHWHGQRLPSGMDGVSGLTQPRRSGRSQTFVYEFTAREKPAPSCTTPADEMTQMAMGMMGSWVTRPKGPHPMIAEVDRDFVFLLNAYDIEPGSYTPRIMTMLDQPVELEQPGLPGDRCIERPPATGCGCASAT